MEAQYKFYLRAELKDLLVVNVLTQELTAFVECGLNKISAIQSEITLPVYA